MFCWQGKAAAVRGRGLGECPASCFPRRWFAAQQCGSPSNEPFRIHWGEANLNVSESVIQTQLGMYIIIFHCGNTSNMQAAIVKTKLLYSPAFKKESVLCYKRLPFKTPTSNFFPNSEQPLLVWREETFSHKAQTNALKCLASCHQWQYSSCYSKVLASSDHKVK